MGLTGRVRLGGVVTVHSLAAEQQAHRPGRDTIPRQRQAGKPGEIKSRGWVRCSDRFGLTTPRN